MEFIGVYDMRETFSKVLEAAQRAPHVVLHFNRPKAVVLGANGKDVLELIRGAGVPLHAAAGGAGAKGSGAKAKPGDRTVQFIKVNEAREQLSRTLDQAQKTPFVVLSHGKPTAVIIGVDGQDIGDLVAKFGAWAESQRAARAAAAAEPGA